MSQHLEKDERARREAPIIDVILPAINERKSIALVLDDLPWAAVREAVVVDNGSTDGTGEVARKHGATVIHEARRGYGSACLAGIEELARRSPPPDIVVFLDADYSDHPDELPSLVKPLIDGKCDLAEMIITRSFTAALPTHESAPRSVSSPSLPCSCA